MTEQTLAFVDKWIRHDAAETRAPEEMHADLDALLGALAAQNEALREALGIALVFIEAEYAGNEGTINHQRAISVINQLRAALAGEPAPRSVNEELLQALRRAKRGHDMALHALSTEQSRDYVGDIVEEAQRDAATALAKADAHRSKGDE